MFDRFFSFPLSFFCENYTVYEITQKNYGRSGQATDDNTGCSKSLCAPVSVYSNQTHTIDDFKMAITRYIPNVDRAILNIVF